MAKFEGDCFICGKTAGKIALKNHVLKEHNEGDEKCYLMRAESIYKAEPYWLLFTLPISAKLGDIDDFLREIWLECCDHSSAFGVNQTEFPMTMALNEFDLGDKLGYDYDYERTTTELIVTFLDEISRPKQIQKVQLLARNIPVESYCWICDKPAMYTDADASLKELLVCNSCSKKCTREEARYVPITNSPRSGSCHYEGSRDIWVFNPKRGFPQPNIKGKSYILREQPGDTIPFNDDIVLEFVDDFDDLNLITIEEVRAAGELDLYLKELESFDAIGELAIALAYEKDSDEVESLAQFLDFTVEQLQMLTEEEKDNYDLSAIYETHEKVSLVLGDEYNMDDIDLYEGIKNNFKTIEETKKDGKLEEFLKFCENFSKFPRRTLRKLIDEEQIKMLELICNFVMFTVDKLEELSDDEKAGYDFTTLYKEHETLIELTSNVLGKKAQGFENFTIPKQAKPPKQAAKNVINLFGDPVQPTAEEKWNKLPADFKERVINNIYCMKCAISKIKDYTIHQESGRIVLRGKCVECNNKVARIIEEV